MIWNYCMYDGKFMWNPDEIVDILAAQYNQVSSTESYPLDFLEKKKKIKLNKILTFELKGRTYRVPFTMKELQSGTYAASDIAAVPDDIPYSVICQLLDVDAATLLVLYNAIWTQGKYPKCWKEVIIYPSEGILLKQKTTIQYS